MWPLRVISDKLAKMIKEGDETEDFETISLGRGSYFIDVPHVRQMFNWDCGLACVLMVIRTLGIENYDITDLENLCSTTSIWTVDLAYLLHKFSVDFSFLTITIGVNPHYSDENYYREQLQDDLRRVGELFQKAVNEGIQIQCRSISANEISLLILSGRYIAVALVDKTKLNSPWVNRTDYLNEESDYMGHYIVICGYDVDSGEFEIRDPASSRKHERVKMESLDEARKSFGTDEDIILVSINGKEGNGVSSNFVIY